MLAKNKAWLADLLESKNASLSIKSASPYVHVTGNMICGFNNGNNAPSNRSGDGSVSSYYSCLSDTDFTDSACLSATQHGRTRQHHLPLPHSGRVSRPRLPLAMPRSTATRRKAPYSIAAPL